MASADQPVANGVSLTIDAVKLLDAAADARVHIALHGHQHMPRVIEYRQLVPKQKGPRNSLYISSAGSAGVLHARRPLAVRNTYSLLRLSRYFNKYQHVYV